MKSEPHVEPLLQALEKCEIDPVWIRVNQCGDLNPAAADSERILCVSCESLNEAAQMIRELSRYMSPDQFADVAPPYLIRRTTPNGLVVGLMCFTKATGQSSLQ